MRTGRLRFRRHCGRTWADGSESGSPRCGRGIIRTMTLATSTPSILRDAAEGRAVLRLWTVDDYHTAIRTGVLEEDPTYELPDGLIVRKERSAAGEDPMTVGDRHRISVGRLARLTSDFER